MTGRTDWDETRDPPKATSHRKKWGAMTRTLGPPWLQGNLDRRREGTTAGVLESGG